MGTAGDSGEQRGTGLQGSSSKGNSRAILLLLENETNVKGGDSLYPTWLKVWW